MSNKKVPIEYRPFSFGVDTNPNVGVPHNDVDKEWQDMPEYHNVLQPTAKITALFKFRNKEDFEKFNKLVRKYLYDDVRVFDGMQKKHEKQAWYPHVEKGSNYLYIEEDSHE